MQPAITEMIMRYAGELYPSWPLAVIVLAASLMLLTLDVRKHLERLPRGTHALALLLLVVGALTWAWQLRWLCDDAYISFRYAKNLAGGHGLVFNIGERVEGYTNFLWTVLLAGAIRVGLDPGQTSIVVTLLCFAALIVGVARIGWLLRRSLDGPIVPLAAILAAASYTLASFGTSGLETMFAAATITWALERALVKAHLAAGCLGIAAALAHPDHGVLYAALGAAILLDTRKLRDLSRYAAPFVLVYVPYFLWRWNYYGDFFPNTYYAKSGHDTYFIQGGRYIASWLIGSGFWLALPLVLWGLWCLRTHLLGRYALLGLPLFLVYIAKIGGDFMYGRLLSPVIPIGLLIAEAGLRDLFQRRCYVAASVALVSLLVFAVPTRIIQPSEKKWHIADERTFYELESFDPIVVSSKYFDWGRALERIFGEAQAKPTIAVGCVGMIGHLSDLPLVDLFGLTDRHIAHRPLAGRGRPGHERLGTPGYLFERDVDLAELSVYPAEYKRFSKAKIGPIGMEIVRYDPDVLSPVRGRPDVRLKKFETRVDELLRQARQQPPHRRACDAWFVQEFFLSEVEDRERQQAVDKLVVSTARGTRYDHADIEAPPASHRGYHVVPGTRIDFGSDSRTRFSDTPVLVRRWTQTEAPAGQSYVYGAEGPFLDTFDSELGDAHQGVLRSRPFKLEGDFMELRVGGGRQQKQVRVSLLVDGRRRYDATGCNTEVLGRRVWDIRKLKGSTARLEVVDRASSGWGHLVLDEIVQLRRDDAAASHRASDDGMSRR